MSSDAINISIMDKEYLVSCSEKERDALRHAVDMLNGKMLEMRDGGKAIGTERIAVMAALNLVHDLIECQKNQQSSSIDLGAGIQRMNEKITFALERGKQLEL